MKSLSAKQLAALTNFDSATIANVIELFGLRSQAAGYTNHTIKAVYPEFPPAVGFAVTATLRTAYPKDSAEYIGGLPKLVAATEAIPEPRMIVIQDLDDPPRAAAYGEVMVASFQRFACAGLITNGAGRDIQQVRQRRFPCWVSSLIVSHGYSRIIDIQVPVSIGGLSIRPGDLLHADGNGVVNIPAEISDGVVDMCDPYVKAEQRILNSLQNESPSVDAYEKTMGEFKQSLDKLKVRAREFTVALRRDPM